MCIGMYGWTYGRKYIYIYILLYERLILLKYISMSVYVYLLIFFTFDKDATK